MKSIVVSSIVLIIAHLGARAQQSMGISELGPQFFQQHPLDQFSIDLFVQQDYLLDSTYSYKQLASSVSEAWELQERITYEYNSNGLVAQAVHSRLDMGDWRDVEQEHFMYRPDGLILTHATRKAEIPGGQLINHRQTYFSYTYFGEVSEVNISEWHVNEWRPLERIVRIFNENNILDEQVSYTWNPAAEEWLPLVMVVYSFENETLTEERTMVWDANSASWRYKEHRSYIIEDGVPTSEVHATWSEAEQDFVTSAITFTEYNEGGQPTLVDHAPFGNDELGQQGQLLSSNYGDKGQLEESILSVWDPESESWVPKKREVHYWSKHLRGKPGALTRDVTCTFANPYTRGLPWYCDNLNREILYSVTVVDLVGRIYHSGTFKGGQTFRISSHIPPGFYVVQISGGLDLHAEKILVR